MAKPALPWKSDGLGVVPPAFALPATNGRILPVRVLKAGEYDLYSAEMQERFWATEWKITHHSDRGGYRLSGQPLKLAAPVELRSYGLVAGIVQVPPSGEPIIQLSDANTAGGYPKIAAVIEADLWRLAQARLAASSGSKRWPTRQPSRRWRRSPTTSPAFGERSISTVRSDTNSRKEDADEDRSQLGHGRRFRGL